MKTPIVLPTVHVAVGDTGALTADIDGTPYAVGRTLYRGDLRKLLTEITRGQQTAVRVEVTEHDGTRYADIAVPPAADPMAAEHAGDAADAGQPKPTGLPTPASPAPTHSRPGICGTGFGPGEQVAVAYVLLHQTADPLGRAMIHLPPSALASRRASVVLLGLDSNVAVVLEAPA